MQFGKINLYFLQVTGMLKKVKASEKEKKNVEDDQIVPEKASAEVILLLSFCFFLLSCVSKGTFHYKHDHAIN